MRFLCLTLLLVTAVYGRALHRQKRGEHWVKAWLVTEEQLRDADANDVQKVEDLIRADMAKAKAALNNLLNGRGSREDEEMAGKLVGGALYLAELHAEHGAESIQPADVKVPKGCTRAAIEGLQGCDNRMMRLGTCVRDGIEATEEVIDSMDNVVNKVAYLKGVVHLVAEGFKEIFPIVEHCFRKDEEKRGDDDWAKLATVDADTLGSASAAEIESVKKGLQGDLEDIDDDLDNLLKEGPESEHFDKVARHLDGAVALASLHEDNIKSGGKPIPPADLSEHIPDGCKPAAFKKRNCDENFEAAVKCLKGAVEGIQKTLDSDLPAAKKVSVAKGVVGLVAKARDPLRKLAAACKGNKERRSFLSNLGAYLKTRK